ncbi:hypothetical protein ACFWJV_09910 [Streptomyces rochei]|uniref:hypothetical protein n=1 Tax=Streptomyces TaxID=1883 RepID=UPI00249C9F6F|nr:hypothetical protein [Streptomyces sp. AN-3]MDI3098411.1 hypothetical protein [Streptomyces sp. AN-3]
MTALETRVGVRAYLAYWVTTLPARVLAAAAVVAAWRPWATVNGAGDAVLLACAVAFALWAAPSPDRRPSRESTRWSHLLLRHRTTVSASGVVVIAAAGDPTRWESACVAALLVAHLVTSETWPWRWGRGTARVWVEAATACAGAGVVLTASAVPVDGAGSGLGRVIAAGVIAGSAVVGGAVLRARWRGRDAGTPHPR